MTKKEIEFRDPVVEAVVDKFVGRSDVGFAKYGKTLRDDKSNLLVWANHLQEELMDAVLYMQRLKEELQDLQEDIAIKKIEVKYEYVQVYPETQNSWHGDVLRSKCTCR